jgi:hypothetical protein
MASEIARRINGVCDGNNSGRAVSVPRFDCEIRDSLAQVFNAL